LTTVAVAPDSSTRGANPRSKLALSSAQVVHHGSHRRRPLGWPKGGRLLLGRRWLGRGWWRLWLWPGSRRSSLLDALWGGKRCQGKSRLHSFRSHFFGGGGGGTFGGWAGAFWGRGFLPLFSAYIHL